MIRLPVASCALVIGLSMTFSARTIAQELVVPYERNYPPFSSTTATGEHEGYNIAVARALAETAGLEIRFEPVGFYEIADGEWPTEWGYAVASVSFLEARESLYTYLGEYVYDEVILVTRNSDDSETRRPEAGSRIGVCRACAYKEYLEGDILQTHVGEAPPPPFPDIEINDSYSSETAMIEALSLSNSPPFDFVVVSRFFADFAFIRTGYPIKIASEPLYRDPLFVIASNDRPELHELLRQALEQIRSDGTISGLSERYLGADFSSDGN